MRSARKFIQGGVALVLASLLSACFESPSDLLGQNANNIVRMDAIFAFRGQISYAKGSGKSVELCRLEERDDMMKPCSSRGKIAVERTSRGNYIVQHSDAVRNHFGLWFRTDESTQGKAGFSCFVWLGDGLVGNTDMSSVKQNFDGSPIFTELSLAVRKVATEAPINRQQLLKIAAAYESVLSPILTNEVRCIGERLNIKAQYVEISGDNRHLQQFVPGPTPSN